MQPDNLLAGHIRQTFFTMRATDSHRIELSEEKHLVLRADESVRQAIGVVPQRAKELLSNQLTIRAFPYPEAM